MSASLVDTPGVSADSFSASLVETPGAPHNLTVSGKATGDYRVQDVQLVRPRQHGAANLLILEVTWKLGPVANPHPDIERVWPLQYSEKPAHHRYTQVEIVSGEQRFTIEVIAAL